jgi:hypothetical protein
MLIQCLVRDIQHDPANEIGRVTVETTNPLAIIDFRVFTKNATGKANLASLISLKGKNVLLPLDAGLYKGELQYQIPFGETINVNKAAV